MTQAVPKDASRRMQAITNYINSLEDTLLDATAKADLTSWTHFLGSGTDSTQLFRWYGNFHAVLGYYIAAVQERVDLAKYVKDKIAATCRKALEKRTAGGKVTEAAAKAEAYLNPMYEQKVEDIAKLERLLGLLEALRRGYDADVVQGFGHNQRAELNADNR